MADPNAAIQTLLAWARQGLTTLPADPLGTNVPGSAVAQVDVRVSGAAAPVRQAVRLYGPADIAGIDPRHVIRTEPANLASNFESNFLAAIEFDRPDFPWLFTPASPNAQNKLRPWLVLVVVRQQDGVNILGGTDRPLPVLEIKTPAVASAELPNLVDSWAWAHGQVAGKLTAQVPLSLVEAQNPERTASRLLCTRRLAPKTAYHACVVPAFLPGVKAGLGLPLVAADRTSLQPAWPAGVASVQLPIYFRWQFQTGEEGDFASLVKLITSYQFPTGMGVRDLDASAAGQRMPSVAAGTADAIVGLESALVAPKTPPRPWTSTFSNQFRAALRGLLEMPADTAADPLVTPPLYAGKHAGQVRPPADGAPPQWLRDLNLHPGYRAIAGWGTRVVQQQQEALMASAWDQVGEVERANNLLRHGQLVRAASGAIYQRSLNKMNPGPLLEISRPIHARVTVAPQTTLQKALTSNNMPVEVVTPEFRKVARPNGPMLRSVVPVDQRLLRPFVSKLVATTAVIAIPRPAPGVATPEAVSSRYRAAGGTYPVASPPVNFGQLQGFPISVIGPQPNFAIRQPELPGVPIPITGIWISPGPDNPTAARYRAAITAHQVLLGPGFISFFPPRPTLKMETVSPMVLAQLHPDVAISGWVRKLAKMDGQPASGTDLEPVAAAPEFPQPMYAALRDLAPDLIVAGLSEIPANKVGLLETNPRFVEAYMAGLNHEMARELLWRGYPTDQRGTYFRTFWDSRGRGPAMQTALGGDIPPIHTWPETKKLGEIASGGSNSLVLLIKAELLRRYPNAIVYAVNATIAAGQTKPKLGTLETHPIFRGTLDADVAFFGFPFPLAFARGTGTPTSPGVFFVIQEHPTEPRFGVPAGTPVTTPLTPGLDAAATARALLQKPVRLAIHARDLLKGLPA